ncbi:hypothetical protein [Galbitalea soli]|uniref:Asp23/Gls24 family envelope stress response protein n=1 Tax=Galbitalea soli TaxID=1268042 RepID=A0A7C9TRH4_9MICO|nr:hypothetical protein [Galbitalea soli]NEM91621.1 hypothetical protein [Galbitalea soli]NYJ30315.1 hypothetical protein [Galbitalea soli]
MAISVPRPTTAPRVAGRIDVTRRALERAVSAVAAEQLGVPPRQVAVTLSDLRGSLAIEFTAPLATPPLREAAERGVRVIARGQDARAAVARAVPALTGRAVARVDLRFRSATPISTGRVS